MVPLGDRIDGWWDRPTAGFRRRALVGTSREDSAKDEAQVRALGFVPASRMGERGAVSGVCDERLRHP